jgi:hypothetical protein
MVSTEDRLKRVQDSRRVLLFDKSIRFFGLFVSDAARTPIGDVNPQRGLFFDCVPSFQRVLSCSRYGHRELRS